MSKFSEKILRGVLPGEGEWAEHLIEAHRTAPSMRPQAFAPHKTRDGKNSYEILAETLFTENLSVLDLACGDGHLIQYLLPRLGANGKIVGVDMSSGELDVAKKHYHDSRVEFHLAKAEALPLKDASLDLALSHMAFMLMTPIEPVVTELFRVLKPGGKFAAVIGGTKGGEGAAGELRKVYIDFVFGRYPKFREAMTGDPRLQTDSGLSEIFRNKLTLEEVREFSLRVIIPPNSIWEWVKDLYFVGMLPENEKAQLQKELTVFANNKSTAGRYQFECSMKMITARRN